MMVFPKYLVQHVPTVKLCSKTWFNNFLLCCIHQTVDVLNVLCYSTSGRFQVSGNTQVKKKPAARAKPTTCAKSKAKRPAVAQQPQKQATAKAVAKCKARGKAKAKAAAKKLKPATRNRVYSTVYHALKKQGFAKEHAAELARQEADQQGLFSSKDPRAKGR